METRATKMPYAWVPLALFIVREWGCLTLGKFPYILTLSRSFMLKLLKWFTLRTVRSSLCSSSESHIVPLLMIQHIFGPGSSHARRRVFGTQCSQGKEAKESPDRKAIDASIRLQEANAINFAGTHRARGLRKLRFRPFPCLAKVFFSPTAFSWQRWHAKKAKKKPM